MSLKIFDMLGNEQSKYDNYYGDGIHDDTTALQYLIDSSTRVAMPNAVTIKLTEPLEIDISKLHNFNGGNSIFLVNGDFPAFKIIGSMVSGTADPDSLTEQIINQESGFVFENCKIIGNVSTSGSGIEISGCVNITINKCYIANLKDGIVIKNRNRDIILTDNNIYKIYDCGIKIDSSVNLHQMNIVGNMIQYCHKCIYINNVLNYANYQITGNDIEIATYPDVDLINSRCVLVDIDDNKSGYFAELILCGNTIQGHSQSNALIEIDGGNVVKYTSITGNHISNCKLDCIKISKCADTSIVGNTFKNDTYRDENNHVLKIDGCVNTILSANTFSLVGRLVDINGESNSNSGVIISSNVGACNHAPVTQEGTNSGVLIVNNVINGAVYPD